MADLLETACYDILCLLEESLEPAQTDGCHYVEFESAVRELTALVDALRERDLRFVELCPDDRLQHRLFDLSTLALLTDVGELSADDLVLDLISLCSALQSDAAHTADTSKRMRSDGAAASSSHDVSSADKTLAEESCSEDSNRVYEEIGYLLETYVRSRTGDSKYKMADVWRRVERVVGEFTVRDAERSCVALRRRLDDVAEAAQLLAVVEGGTPLGHFLRPQVDDIFAALKEDALEAPVSLADRLRLVKRRLGRWLRRLFGRIVRCLRRSLAAL